MKKYLLIAVAAAAIATASASQPSTNQATQNLEKAHSLYDAGHFKQAVDLDLEVLATKGLPDQAYSAGFLLMGNMAIDYGNFYAATLAYNHVLPLNVPKQDIEAAAQGLVLAQALLDQRREQQDKPRIDYR